MDVDRGKQGALTCMSCVLGRLDTCCEGALCPFRRFALVSTEVATVQTTHEVYARILQSSRPAKNKCHLDEMTRRLRSSSLFFHRATKPRASLPDAHLRHGVPRLARSRKHTPHVRRRSTCALSHDFALIFFYCSPKGQGHRKNSFPHEVQSSADAPQGHRASHESITRGT